MLRKAVAAWEPKALEKAEKSSPGDRDGTTPLLLGKRLQTLSCSQVIAADQLVGG